MSTWQFPYLISHIGTELEVGSVCDLVTWLVVLNNWLFVTFTSPGDTGRWSENVAWCFLDTCKGQVMFADKEVVVPGVVSRIVQDKSLMEDRVYFVVGFWTCQVKNRNVTSPFYNFYCFTFFKNFLPVVVFLIHLYFSFISVFYCISI